MTTWLETQYPELSGISAIKEGGQKFVYDAHHKTYGNVVLKVLKLGQNPERTIREVMATTQYHFKNVPQILDVRKITTPAGDSLGLIEEKIEGVDLRHKLRTNGPLTPYELLKLAHDVLEVIVEAEKARIVHRDIKPENIIVEKNGNYWLLDFGIARFLDMDSLTASGRPFGVGTYGYSPPEQIRNKKIEIDSRADFFAIGVVLYECATGGNPFRIGARDEMEIMDRVENMPLPSLNLSFDKDKDFAHFVSALTQKYKDQRPTNAQDALNWINDIIAKVSP